MKMNTIEYLHLWERENTAFASDTASASFRYSSVDC